MISKKLKEVDTTYIIENVDDGHMEVAVDSYMVMQRLPKKDRVLRKFHSMKDHIFYMNRYGHCLYCDEGSKPVNPKLLKLFDNEIEDILRKEKK